MSLMLRKAAQPILDSAALDAYHVEINSDSKNLVLKTVCGKPFATVHGVIFNRLQATNAEIEYALELLQLWLTRNETKLDAYHDALAILQKYSKASFNKSIGNFKCKCEDSYNYDNITHTKNYYYYINVKSSYVNFKITDENFDSTSISNVTFIDSIKIPAVLDKKMPTKKEYEQMHKLHKEFITFKKATKEVDKIKENLNSCVT